jgi:two-component system, NarL family, sensor histidine kinase DevS
MPRRLGDDLVTAPNSERMGHTLGRMTERARKLDASRLRVISGGSPTPAPSYRLLTQVSAALSTSLDLDGTLKEILERMNALVAFDAATIFLLDDSRTELHVKAALGVPVSLKEVQSFRVGEGVVGWVVRHGASALIQDSRKDARYKATGAERRPKTVLAAPLRAQDNLLGALVLVRAAKEPFGPEHQRLVEAIASQAAVAIDHARLFETERASRRRAEALFATAQAGSEAVSTPELLQRAVKQVAFSMRATAAAIILPDEEGEVIEAAFDAADPPAFGLESLRSRPVDALPLLAALRGVASPLVLWRTERPSMLDDAFWSRSEAQALAAVPIRWQNRLMAGLLVGFNDPERLTASELELLDEIGRQVALGMERLRLQARVQDQQNEMAVGAERNRIARDMHDGLVQYVYALGLQLEHARDVALSQPDTVSPILGNAIQQLNHVLSEMRTFIYQLRPIIMKEKEIGQWVVDLCGQFEQATGIPVVAEVGASAGEELSPEISIALFRIIQEALANIYKHAQASRASLSLHFTPEGARLLIEDDGRGFDPGQRPAPAIERGHGLTNIEERVRDLGATVKLTTALGQGTRLEAVFPYSR